MKISYSNFPILKKLTEEKLGKLEIFMDDKPSMDNCLEDYKLNWLKNKDYFKKNIYYISKPFHEAVIKSYDKLSELYNDIVVNDLDDYIIDGTFIINNNVYMIHNDIRRGSDEFNIVFYVFTKEGIPLIYFKHINYDPGWFSWLSTSLGIKKQEDFQNIIAKIIGDISMINMFKNFSQVEIKEVSSRSKIKDINCKYVNDTNSTIKFLDSKWYTTLVKSDAFNVSGHLRWQPKKVNGEWTKELIWIEDFQKKGYIRKASKLLSE